MILTSPLRWTLTNDGDWFGLGALIPHQITTLTRWDISYLSEVQLWQVSGRYVNPQPLLFCRCIQRNLTSAKRFAEKQVRLLSLPPRGWRAPDEKG